MFAQLLLYLRRFAGDAVCAVVCGLLSGAALAQAGGAVQTPSVSFPQAWEQLQTQSHGLAASAKAVEGTRLRREGMQGLGAPRWQSRAWLTVTKPMWIWIWTRPGIRWTVSWGNFLRSWVG